MALQFFHVNRPIAEVGAAAEDHRVSTPLIGRVLADGANKLEASLITDAETVIEVLPIRPSDDEGLGFLSRKSGRASTGAPEWPEVHIFKPTNIEALVNVEPSVKSLRKEIANKRTTGVTPAEVDCLVRIH